MNLKEAREKIQTVRSNLLKMQEITSFVKLERAFESHENMTSVEAAKNKKLQRHWDEVQKNLPSGFSVEGNLIRHLAFNEANDWYNISNNDIPYELNNIVEYEKKLALIEYLETLHPSVARVSEIVLNGDIDAALKTVFTSLDSQIRLTLNPKPSESTVSMIGKAFNDGSLVATHSDHNDAARNFLQGVIGYYRNIIAHNPLPSHRNKIETSLSLFGVAHEAFRLLDLCSRDLTKPE